MRHTTLLPLSLLAIAPALLPAATVEERLAELETRLGALSAENTALKQQLDTVAKKQDLPVVLPAGKTQKLSIGGYIQVNGETGGMPDNRFPDNDRFLIRRARLTVKGEFAEDIDFVLQPEFGNGNLTANANYRAQLADVFIRWKKFDFATVTAGQFKTPYGYEQLIQDTKNPFIERSLPNDRLTLSRQIGVMVSGDLLDKRLSYATGAFNGNAVNNGGNDNEHLLTVGRVSGIPLKTKSATVSVGANAFSTSDGTGAAALDRVGYGFDAQLKAGRLDASVEWLRQESDPVVGADVVADGWSAQTGYMVLDKKLRAGLRYETYDPSDTVSKDEYKTWTLGLTWFLKGDDVKFSLNYLVGDSPAGGDDNRLIGQAQVVF